MIDGLKSYYTVIEDNIIVVVFENELIDLSGCEIEGYPFWYVMGTDAWFEKQTINKKDFFSIPIDNRTSELFNEEKGILVLSPNFELKAKDIKQTNDLEGLREWIDKEIGGENIGGTICCFYTEEAKRKYHKKQK
ncbi:MAG: hypothetical protein KGV59_06905 [Tenacibaculum sp.]|nr:hypothetical protein [Tenacibaculum sp.]